MTQAAGPRLDGQATVLFMLYPERSAFNASWTLARRLQARGCRVLYGGPQGFREHVEAQGFAYRTIDPAPASATASTDATVGPRSAWHRVRQQVRQRRAAFSATLHGWEHCLEVEHPSLVLLDALMWRHASAPLRCGVPIVGFSTALAGPYDPSVPPVSCRLAPTSRWRHRAAWARRLLPVQGSMLLSTLLAPFGLLSFPRSGSMAAVRRAGGRLRWSEYGPRLDVPEIVASPRELDFPAAIASDQRIYAGTCVEPQRNDGDFDWPWFDAERPLLYCSLGSYSHVYPHSRRLFDAVVGALRQRPDWQAVVHLGTCADAFGELPSRIRLVRHAPQLEVLQRAQVFVTHGGLGSVREAILYGVPMLAFPCANDQPGNAARIAWHGIGMAGDIATVDDAALLGMLDEVAAPHCAARIGAMQRAFSRQRDCRPAVDHVLALLDRAAHRKTANG